MPLPGVTSLNSSGPACYQYRWTSAIASGSHTSTFGSGSDPAPKLAFAGLNVLVCLLPATPPHTHPCFTVPSLLQTGKSCLLRSNVAGKSRARARRRGRIDLRRIDLRGPVQPKQKSKTHQRSRDPKSTFKSSRRQTRIDQAGHLHTGPHRGDTLSDRGLHDRALHDGGMRRPRPGAELQYYPQQPIPPSR